LVPSFPLDRSSETSDDPTHLFGLSNEQTGYLLAEITDVLRNVDMRAKLGAGSLRYRKKLLKLRQTAPLKPLGGCDRELLKTRPLGTGRPALRSWKLAGVLLAPGFSTTFGRTRALSPLRT
jgi:hypothetical protein